MQNAAPICQACFKGQNHGTPEIFIAKYGVKKCGVCGKYIQNGEKWAWGIMETEELVQVIDSVPPEDPETIPFPKGSRKINLERIERMEYLFSKAMETSNPEQQEAYCERLDRHWQKHLEC